MKTAIGPTIMLASGEYFDYTDPAGSNFTIWDIAVALGKICRYGGHCNDFYSVAEHSVYVSQIVGPEWQLQALLHDATEAFMVDIPRPLKQLLPEYSRMEDELAEVIYAKLGVPYPFHPSVKKADMIMLLTELRQIMPNPNDHWPCTDGLEPADIKIECLMPHQATSLFMQRYLDLSAKINYIEG